MSIIFTQTTALEHNNGVLLGTLDVSGYGEGTFQYYFGEVDWLKFVGNKVYLGDNWHYDQETRRLID